MFSDQCCGLVWDADFGLMQNYPEDLKSKVADGSISFVAQDYFKPNVSDGAVWYMRGVL